MSSYKLDPTLALLGARLRTSLDPVTHAPLTPAIDDRLHCLEKHTPTSYVLIRAQQGHTTEDGKSRR
jgi:hypothetical protein